MCRGRAYPAWRGNVSAPFEQFLRILRNRCWVAIGLRGVGSEGKTGCSGVVRAALSNDPEECPRGLAAGTWSTHGPARIQGRAAGIS